LALGLMGSAAIISAHLIWLVYRYRYSASPESGFSLEWDETKKIDALPMGALRLARDHKLLPEAYLFGVIWQLSRPPHTVFLNGEIGTDGWWYYFPEAILLKSTPSLLVLVGAIGACLLVRRLPLSLNGLFLIIPLLYFLLITCWKAMNLGHRYVAPIYPLLFVIAGLSGRALDGINWKSGALVVLLLGHTMSSLAAYPRYLSYFNSLRGGPDQGWKYLLDSNIDWGQDLSRLKDWMIEKKVPRVHLAYFGTGDPKAYGIPFEKLQCLDWLPTPVFSEPGSGEYVAVSVMLLQGVGVQGRELADYLRRIRQDWAPVGRAGDSILVYRVP
jgi:hypothetical protein